MQVDYTSEPTAQILQCYKIGKIGANLVMTITLSLEYEAAAAPVPVNHILLLLLC